MLKKAMFLTDIITRDMKFKLFVLFLFIPILSHGAIEHCINSKFKELVEENAQKKIDHIHLKKIATKVCNSINTEKIVKIKSNSSTPNSRVLKSAASSLKSQCIKRRLLQLGVQHYKGDFNKITELKNIATADCFNVSSTNIYNSNRTSSNSRDLSNMNFKVCVKQRIYELGGMTSDRDFNNQIKDQATRECL